MARDKLANRSLRHALNWYKSLSTQKGRRAAGAFLVHGPRAVGQIMRQQPDAILEILTLDQPPHPDWKGAVGRITETQMRAIAPTKTPQGMLAVVRLPVSTYTDALPPVAGAHILLLEDVQDPGNVGTLIRTATAFGFSGIILTDKCADPFSPKCVQSTAGTVLALWLRRTPRYLALLNALQQSGYVCLAADLRGEAEPSELARHSRLVLALGNEAAGLSPGLVRMADARVKIPLRGNVESLNVASCGAICMYFSLLSL